ncbi:MAG: hypothetical protein M0Z59_00050 [Nitrospiraceae bacterium]|nr:hypothetical protein [Nitrospiraceae bacterium]
MAGKIEIDVPKQLCAECSLALGRFMGHIKGVDSIDMEEGKVVISYDDGQVSRDFLIKLSKETLEKIGHHE